MKVCVVYIGSKKSGCVEIECTCVYFILVGDACDMDMKKQ